MKLMIGLAIMTATSMTAWAAPKIDVNKLPVETAVLGYAPNVAPQG